MVLESPICCDTYLGGYRSTEGSFLNILIVYLITQQLHLPLRYSTSMLLSTTPKSGFEDSRQSGLTEGTVATGDIVQIFVLCVITENVV